MPTASCYRPRHAPFKIANLTDIRYRMTRFYSSCWLILALSLTSCGGSDADSNALSDAVLAPPVSAEQQRLEDFFTATWAEDLVRYPASASYLAVTDRQDQWNDVTESSSWRRWQSLASDWIFSKASIPPSYRRTAYCPIDCTDLTSSARSRVPLLGIIVM